MSLESIKQLPFCFTTILQGLRLYPPKHPQIQKHLNHSVVTLNKMLESSERLTIGLLDGTLLVNEIPYLDHIPALQELQQLLRQQHLQALEILPGVDADQLLIFCQQLPQRQGDDFSQRLESLGVRAIRTIKPEEDKKGPAETYQQALKSVETICSDVRLGRIPSSKEAISSAKGMVTTILEQPYTLLALAMLKDYDNYTFNHSVNVAVLAMSVGKACNLSDNQLYQLGLGGLFHDLGKMTISRRIVNKPGKLNTTEYEVMRQHPANGAKIVTEMEQIPASVIDIVSHHHLGFDGSGYPEKKQGQKLSPLTEMASIADTYDAITTVRCYQQPCSPKQAIEKMKTLSGSYLNPVFLARFIDYLGPYPVGTLVRLRNSAIGLICDQNQQQPGALTIKLIIDGAGERYSDPPLLELPDSSKIVAEVDPTLKGVQLNKYLI